MRPVCPVCEGDRDGMIATIGEPCAACDGWGNVSAASASPKHGGPRTPGPGKRLGRPPGAMDAKLVVRAPRDVLDAYKALCEAEGIEMAEDVRLFIVERLRGARR